MCGVIEMEEKKHFVKLLNNPVFRGPVTHGVIAELQEGFRWLSGDKPAVLTSKELYDRMKLVNIQVSEETVCDLLRSFHLDSGAAEFSFSDFVSLMTEEVTDEMKKGMLSVFENEDKEGTGLITKKKFNELFVSKGEKSPLYEKDELCRAAEHGEEESEFINYRLFVENLTS